MASMASMVGRAGRAGRAPSVNMAASDDFAITVTIQALALEGIRIILNTAAQL